MTAEEAIQILDQAVSAMNVNREVTFKFIECVQVIKKAIDKDNVGTKEP